MPYVDDIKSGNITLPVAWTILVVAFTATAAVITFLNALARTFRSGPRYLISLVRACRRRLPVAPLAIVARVEG